MPQVKKVEKMVVVFVVEGVGASLRIGTKKIPVAKAAKLPDGHFGTFGDARAAAMNLLTLEIDNLRSVRNGIWSLQRADVLKGKAKAKQERAAGAFWKRVSK